MQHISITISTFLISLYLILLIAYRREYDSLYSQIDDNKYIKAIYLPFMIVISKNIKNRSRLLTMEARKSIQYFNDPKYYQYYELIYLSKKFSIIHFISITISIFISLSTADFLIISLPLINVLVFRLLDNQQYSKYKKAKNDMKDLLPTFLTRLSLLIQSGIGYRNAIYLIVESSQDILSKEIADVLKKIENGNDEIDAYKQLSFFNEDILIRKFISLVIQNIYKGSEDFSTSLISLKGESWQVRKSNIMIKSKQASQKLLLPNLIIFASIMIMVMVPILLNII